ncbi:hypothetical protein BDB01DRAFT_847809 [Pilobolus umbonatus]|nr:hypothetical protein BDB01DRAFT_847809 [Pilobolus umbonatus]
MGNTLSLFRRPYPGKAIVYQYFMWYRLEELTNLINDIRKVTQWTPDQKRNILERLAAIRRPAPFGPNTRFPDGRVYICELDCAWFRSLQSLNVALRWQLDESMNQQHLNIQSAVNRNRENEQAIINAATQFLIDLKANERMVYNREWFEYQFGIQWEE